MKAVIDRAYVHARTATDTSKETVMEKPEAGQTHAIKKAATQAAFLRCVGKKCLALLVLQHALNLWTKDQLHGKTHLATRHNNRVRT